MGTGLWIGLSAAVWGGSLIFGGAWQTGLLILLGHVIVWQAHRIEVKLNRLLDDHGITVTDSELWR